MKVNKSDCPISVQTEPTKTAGSRMKKDETGQTETKMSMVSYLVWRKSQQHSADSGLKGHHFPSPFS
ncbi:hypothetical protein ACF0H5_002434 [Mactra antiquata]